MKAIVLREFGGPEVLRLEEIPTPIPGPGEVLVKVHAVSVNRTLDLIVRAGKYARPIKLPHILGVDPSGVIAAVGPGVTDRKVGDRVATWAIVKPASPSEGPGMLGLTEWGGYAEYVKIAADKTFLLADSVDFPTATVISRHAPVALDLLRNVAKLQADEWLLIMGAAGGLGSAGIQIAKWFGAKVIAAAGADSRVKACLDLGADVAINYRQQDLTAEVLKATNNQGVNVVFENIADPDLFPKALMSIARYGRMVTIGSHGGGTVPLNVTRLYLHALTIYGSTGRPLAPGAMEQPLQAAAEGKYRVLIDKTLPLAEAPAAHRLVDERNGTGKVILQPSAA